MPFRVSIFDLTTALIVLVVLVLPDRSHHVAQAYHVDDVQESEIALYQARLAVDPGDAEAASKLSELLIKAKQLDWAVQVPGAAAQEDRPDSWRALLATADAYGERVDVRNAHRFAKEALERCRAIGKDACPPHEEARLSIYFSQLQAGLDSGIHPRHDPNGYAQAVFSRMRMIRFRGATPREPDSDTKSPPPEQPPEGAPTP